MKNASILFSILILLILNLAMQYQILPKLAGQETTLKPYGLKSGIIEYSYSGDKAGKGTLYFDDYGMKSAMYTDAVEDGEKRKGWVVTYGDYQYLWDPDRSDEGMKLKNPINILSSQRISNSLKCGECFK